jgi:multidrug resistance efflux pump
LRLNHPDNPPHKVIPPAKSRSSWSRFIYLGLLIILGLAALHWFFSNFSIIKAPGVIEGKRTLLEAPLSAKIEKINLHIGDKISQGEGVIFLDSQELQDQIKHQQSEVKALKTACQEEQKRLPLVLEEQENSLLLKQNTIRQQQQRLMGETRELQLKLSQLNDRLTEQKRLLDEGRRMLRLNAITQSGFQNIKLKLKDLEEEIKHTDLKLKTHQQELAGFKEALDIINEDKHSLPKHIQGKSPLPLLEAKLATATQKLEQLQASLKKRIISVPFSGIVTQIMKQAGEVVTIGEAIAEIVDPASIYVQAFFDLKYQQQLHEGQTVKLLFDNQQQSHGVVSRFYPATNPLPPQFQQVYEPRKKTLIAEIHPIDRKTWPLTIGMGVEVQKSK